jgi:proteasome lid subunit RPN8/RPN11
VYETLFQPSDTTERCGLILKDGTTVEVANIADNPMTSYMMDPVAVLPFLDKAVGTWHTHPHTDPTLSSDDHDGFMLWPKLEHLIIGMRDGEVTAIKYRIEDGLAVLCD